MRHHLCVAELEARALIDWPVRTLEEIAPGDAGTLGRTLPWMRQLVVEGRDNPEVAQYADWLVKRQPFLHPVESVFRHVQSLPYRYDESILAGLGYGSDASELLQGAPYQVRKAQEWGPQSVVGDCDDRAILTQSLLESLGYPTRFVLVRGPGRSDYSHVYSEALVGERWIPLDTIMDGQGGRPFFGMGEEVGPPEARDRYSIPVDQPQEDKGCSGLILPLLLALIAWRVVR